METITIEQLLSLTTPAIIDIRDTLSFQMGHIAGARNIPSRSLYHNPELFLSKNTPYYFYCSFGETSQRLCTHLKELGYLAINVNGGYQSYLNYLKNIKTREI